MERKFKSERDKFEYFRFLALKRDIPTTVHFTHEEVVEVIKLLKALEMTDKSYTRYEEESG